jgi:hypothetical protein
LNGGSVILESSSPGRGEADLPYASGLAGVQDCDHLHVRRAGIGPNNDRRLLPGGKRCEPGSQLALATLLSRNRQCAVARNADGNWLLPVFLSGCVGIFGASSEGEYHRNARDAFDYLLFHR